MFSRFIHAIAILAGLLAPAGCGPVLPLDATPSRTRLAGDGVLSVVPFVEDTVGTPRVAVRGNGFAGEMIVDTGAFSSLLSPAFTTGSRAQTRATDLRSVDAGGNVRRALGIARLETLQLGTGASAAMLQDFEAVVQDLSILDSAGGTMSGALGLPAFRNVLLTFDFPKQQLIIQNGMLPAPNGRDVLPLKVSRTGGPMVPLRVGRREVWTLLDTGFSSGLALPNWARASVPGAKETVPGTPFTFYHGRAANQSDRARLKVDVAVGGHTIERPIAEIGLGNVPVIGTAYLRHFAVTIDQRNGRVAFRRSSQSPIVVPPIVGPGYYVDLTTARIIAIVPNSGADRAGLKVGDQLERIEGMPFADYRAARTPLALRHGMASLTYLRNGRRQSVAVPIGVLVP
ncbi:MAG TPA: aspartyl protease family protein [Tepidisphaeraceae bacterium]|jgi:hypothetical protein|nr:aspartyl protease family protein [Tepidisphaeraceae bacterium]